MATFVIDKATLEENDDIIYQGSTTNMFVCDLWAACTRLDTDMDECVEVGPEIGHTLANHDLVELSKPFL
jgi:hypothetical protein